MIEKANNKATRSKNLRRLRELEPEFFTLADSLGLRLHWRDGEAWGNDVQLTYKQRVIDGRPIVLDEEGRATCAMDILRMIESARSKWGTKMERANAIIDEFIETRIPLGLRRMHFLVAQNNSLDSCHAFGGGFAGDLGYSIEVTVLLIGEQAVRGQGYTLHAAAEIARMACMEAWQET